ncbi:hypothetical protein SAMN05216414_102103 [Nitrosovibrio sp. Nv17]|nr:hypothetical protein SAMN05216414_102103 [Nitrosovibrio sp. Nv17]
MRYTVADSGRLTRPIPSIGGYLETIMTDTSKNRLEVADAECETAAKIELDGLYDDAPREGVPFRSPSPQAVEAILLRLIANKEQAFSRVLTAVLESRSGPLDVRAAALFEEEVRTMLAEERYLGRMQDFFREAAERARVREAVFDTDPKRQELLDATYRLGAAQALRRARASVLATLEPYMQPGVPADRGFISQWQQYSTASPLRPIVTIALLSLTSYAIAVIMASEMVQEFLARFGWAAGTGL